MNMNSKNGGKSVEIDVLGVETAHNSHNSHNTHLSRLGYSLMEDKQRRHDVGTKSSNKNAERRIKFKPDATNRGLDSRQGLVCMRCFFATIF